ncbi:MAG: PQQ-dependent dehydrogenase, methanol/ethanol family [Gemmatimonadaceae bacterium]
MTVKIARYIDGVEVPFEYDNTFGCECVSGCIERLTIGLRGGHSAALALLSTVLSPPYKLLYVLHTSRTGAPLGRYESPALDQTQVEQLFQRFGSYFAEDARHDVWLHSQSGGPVSHPAKVMPVYAACGALGGWPCGCLTIARSERPFVVHGQRTSETTRSMTRHGLTGRLRVAISSVLLSSAVCAVPIGAQGTEDGQWTMPGKNYAATRYSELAQIDVKNVGRLRSVWNFSTGVLAGHEGQPLVVNSTMYVVTPYPNVLYAFDLTKEGYPLKWKYRPAVSPNAVGISCCDVINRGAFYADGKIVYNLLDGHTVAIDAATGREVWKTKTASPSQGETVTLATFIVKNRVIVGVSGGEFGIRGRVTGLDLKTGRIAWIGYNTGPDGDMLAKPGIFKPFYDKGTQLSLNSWPTDLWRHSGAPVWGWMSYDPALDLVYFGVGNPGPYNPEQRVGANKWTNSVLARHPADGSLAWAYQFTPHDNWDYDAVGDMILADLTIKGRPRKVLVHFDKNGFAYTIDRATGEVLVAEPYVDVNWAKRIDLASGRPVLDSSKQTGASKGNVLNVCPSLEGGRSPASSVAYSPLTRLFYASTNNFCMDYQAGKVARIVGTPFIGANTPYHAGHGGNLGAFIAWDAATGRKVWETKEQFPVWSGSVVTSGGIVFYGTLDGWFKAADARTGRALWKFKVGSGVVGNPITYRGPDGKQYVAVYAGIGGDWFLLSGDVRSDDPADVRDPADFIRELARHTSQGGSVWVFAL